VIARHPAVGTKLQHSLREWQSSVLQSLVGKDYRK